MQLKKLMSSHKQTVMYRVTRNVNQSYNFGINKVSILQKAVNKRLSLECKKVGNTSVDMAQ